MNFEAVIIGGGPSGSALALALAQQGRSVAVIEKAAFPRRKVCGEFISAGGFEVLARLGMAERVRELAGPEVRRLALFAAGGAVEAAMPPARGGWPYGRALGRDVLDGLLLGGARASGATVFQPARAMAIAQAGDVAEVSIDRGGETLTLTSPVVVAAHGSWEAGSLATQPRHPRRASDLLAFKARFRGAALASDLMPLLAFPGGYGGMVWSDRRRLSLSCCIRRDRLEAIRQEWPHVPAGQAVLNHILVSCPAAAGVLAGAEPEDDWLGAGPIRPGMRLGRDDGVFRVGNLAGESHPIIAEGISMALQSGAMLATHLSREPDWNEAALDRAARRYWQAWQRHFALRIASAGALYRLASHPLTAALMRQTIRLFPATLPIGARLAGKPSAPMRLG